MLAKRTVLVLGAGASFEFKLPVGAMLAKDIQARLSFTFDIGQQMTGDREIIQTIQYSKRHNIQEFVDGARKIAAALPGFKSIDDCLYTHDHNAMGVLAGKMAIAAAIRDAEAKSTLVPIWSHHSSSERARAISELNKTWVGALVQMLVTGVKRENFRDVFKDISIVSFNYDRCVESALFHLIQPALDLNEAEAAEAMKGLEVYHPYGSLGALPSPLVNGGVPYGASRLDLLAAAENLFVYTETREHPEEIARMQRRVYEADHLVFLGFGFHAQNVRYLSLKGEPLRGKRMLGTVYNEPSPSIAVFKDRLSDYLGIAGPWGLLGATCTEFMTEYGAVIGG